MALNPFVKAILDNPGIDPEKMSKILGIHIETARKNLIKTMRKYPVLHTTHPQTPKKIDVFILVRKKGFAEPYVY